MAEQETPVQEVAEELKPNLEAIQIDVPKEEEVQDPAEPKAEAEEVKKDEEPPKDDQKNHFQRRQERLLRERAEFKAKAEYLEQMMQQQQQKPAQAAGRPARDQYQSDEDYVDALTEWKVDQKLGAVKQELAQTQARGQVQTEWVSKVNQARKDYPDYDTAMEEAQDIPITQSVAEALQSSEIGADIAYYLAKNPEEASRINSLPSIAAAREIGRIESYVEYEKNQKAQKAPVSKAPVPIKPPVRSTSSGTKSLENMSPGEYMTYMNKREAERRRKGRF